MSLVTFIVPVRHQDNARDWKLVKANLSETILSISSQLHSDWQAIIVANSGADLPEIPNKFRVERVNFSPNLLHERNFAPSREDFLDAFRLDKGRRVLAGMLSARNSGFFMIVDDDDFVSNHIVEFASKQPGANGWVITNGYIWDHGGKVMLGHNDFNHICGTCLVVRSDLYELPRRFEDASEDWIKSMLGSHHRITEILSARGTSLAPLPFPGAVYRVAHGGSHSKTPGFIRRHFLSASVIRKPWRMWKNLLALRYVDAHASREFFGGTVPRGDKG